MEIERFQLIDPMEKALELAKQAGREGEVPVGAVVVYKDKIIGQGYNTKESTQLVSRHAEMIAIEQACQLLGSWRLNDCHLFVTLEPCLMCAGAIYQARFKEVTIGAKDPKAGALGSLYEIHKDQRLNHNFPVNQHKLAEDCALLLKEFFRKRRVKN